MNLLYLNEPRLGDEKINHHAKAYELLSEIGDADQEMTVLLSLNGYLNLVGKDLISMGSPRRCMLPPSVVFRRALQHNASSIIIAHNHPSGHEEPSEEDLQVYENLKQLGDMLDIPVLDSLIITEKGYYSMFTKEFYHANGSN